MTNQIKRWGKEQTIAILLPILAILVISGIAWIPVFGTSIAEDQNTNTSSGANEIIISISDKYIFSTADTTLQGEGFFVEFSDQSKIFIYNDNFDRNPHDIENLRRKIEAVQLGVGKLTYSGIAEKEVSAETKLDLGAENTVLTSDEYKGLANQVLESGTLMTINAVSMDLIKIDETKIEVNSSEISSVGPMAMTTGGSVYVFPIYLKNGDQFNIGGATWGEGMLNKLNTLAKEIKGNLNNQFNIVAGNISFQDKIYVAVLSSGARQTWTGWVANIGDVTIVPVVTGLSTTKGTDAIKIGSKKVTVQPFGSSYKGKIYGKEIDFESEQNGAYIFANSEAYKKGGIVLYDSEGKKINTYKPFGGFATSGLNVSTISDTDDTVYLAAATTKAGTTVKTYKVTSKKLISLNSLKATTKSGNIVVKFQKLYKYQSGLVTMLKGNKSTIKVWKFDREKNQFVEDKKFDKKKIKL